ncbi:CocE/NonD family hydrolase [Pseudoduganella sp. FT25W]|uniref:CocE/NonD family hydrolase n=1 Tax=Duganella alba TaxID=2666081 RepID=A0A6L5QNY5_9BURK|nr:CocE/NonD family hydrolase [Duganella alba]MRX11345.1 CocE/NonD family hydrolase [Duganella alba]MRX19420.1 CocE/NonD family hydrolase [Duganella alba]
MKKTALTLALVAGVFTIQASLAQQAALPASTPGVAAKPLYPALPSETPDEFTAPVDSFDYVRRTVMIPMRDGVKLNTVILIPRKAHHAPMLLTRTPYNAADMTAHAENAQLESVLQGYDNQPDVIVKGGYIRVVQDVRGKYGSEGDYVMNRPMAGTPFNPTPVDHSTDSWDTIEWLSKNVPESNGKVGIIGSSYDGFLPLIALVNPHPALKVAVPMNPMVDGWRGDDWFHNGAFRQINLSYIMEQVVTRRNEAHWFTSHYDDYDTFMRAGSAGELARRRGVEQSGFWRKVVAHPAYDQFWQTQAVDQILAKQPITVPTMLVHSLWDAEDIYGAIAVYKAIKPNDKDNKVFLVMGPWNHGGQDGDGTHLGPIKFNSDTGMHFREEILMPFLDRYLKDEPSAEALAATIAPVTAFETGTNKWRALDRWPAGCVTGCFIAPATLRLAADGKATLTNAAPTPLSRPAHRNDYDEYVADPAKPVPYRQRPIPPYGYDEAKGQTWPRWLVDDQREASGRTDVLSYTTGVLTAPVKISGEPVAHLLASTSGTDADWVVKVIDVYPDQVASQPELGGYQLMVSADIFRGRYRESLETARPIAADKALPYRFALPTANHVFLPGHRIMVQIQSSWFPLYDRNPQTFVPNIFYAQPADYKKATQRIYHDSYIELPLVGASVK